MNRFEAGDISTPKKIVRILPILAFLVVVILFLRGLSSVSDTTSVKQQESLETALSHSIAQCYAVEGHYPEDITYLVDHYGLTYDADTFLIDYVNYGDNLYPEVTVLRRTGNSIFY